MSSNQSDLVSRFPDLIPMEKIRVGPESHTYEVIEYDDGTSSAKQRYVPDKAPVLEVEAVSGIVDDESYSFDKGVDYEVLDTDNDGRLETIDFSIGGESPDDNTEFEITYIARSIIVRYVESYQDELDRLGTDLDEAIESHYLDTASETGYIDNFEDEEIVEYDIQAGSELNATVQSNEVFVNDWALELLNPAANDPVRIASAVGLSRYPERGDEIVYYTKLTDTDDISSFDFLWTVDSAGQDRYYRATVDASNDELVVQKDDGSVKQDASSLSLDPHLDTWVRVDITIEPIGDIAVTLSDENGNELTSVSITDVSYTDGGIRWEANNTSTASSVYFDAADIVERSSSDLDRVGAMFGELGKRRGRTDDEYVTFLRSIVQSFSGRGTVDGIKFAVASALNLDPEQIVINEDFVNNEYEVFITVPFPPHEVRTLDELADLADPSGVEFTGITYDTGDDDMGVDDLLSVTEGQQIDDKMAAGDALNIEDPVDPAETIGADDATTVNGNVVVVSETMGTDDDVSAIVSTLDEKWDQFNWDSGQWADLDEFAESDTDGSGMTDAIAVNANKPAVSDTMQADDVAAIDANNPTATDAAGVADTRTTTVDPVYWGSDFESLHWARGP